MAGVTLHSSFKGGRLFVHYFFCIIPAAIVGLGWFFLPTLFAANKLRKEIYSPEWQPRSAGRPRQGCAAEICSDSNGTGNVCAEQSLRLSSASSTGFKNRLQEFLLVLLLGSFFFFFLGVFTAFWVQGYLPATNGIKRKACSSRKSWKGIFSFCGRESAILGWMLSYWLC